jgi:two-component system sensor histidine kinase RstB
LGRLFLKLYSIIALAGIVFFVGVANLDGIMQGTLENYVSNLSQGTYSLIEKRIVDTPEEQWPALLAEVNQGGGYLVAILPIESLNLPASTEQRLRQGDIVASSVDEAVYTYKRIGNSERALQIPFEQTGYEDSQRLVNNTFNLIEKALHEHPQTDWDAILATLSPQFSFPVEIIEQAQDERLENEAKRLADREVILIQLAGEQELYYRRISQSTHIIKLGPFEDSATLENLQIILMFVFSILIALAVLLWIYPLSRDIRQLGLATRSFGQGDFSVRASGKRRSALYRLSKTFNSMADRIQSLMSSHKELTNAVSHELRTPIARLRFGMEMLQDSTREEDRRRFMDSMNSDIDELDQLVAELLTYARFDRDRPELTFQRQEIEPWLGEAVRQAAMGKDDLRIEFDVDGHELKYARFDPLLMARALSNLLENAARYAQTRVQVVFSSDGDCFRLIVDDDGPGIPEQERETVFNAFKRLDSSRDRGTGGYGLGLAIAQRISEWHGGEISVVDSPLGGARFEIRWPQEQPSQG